MSGTARHGLEGKTAFITGAGAGIGRATTLRFLAEGVNVLGVDSEPSRLTQLSAAARRHPGELETVTTDITDAVGVGAAARQALEVFGSIETLVNNAGVFGSPAPLLDMSRELWRRVLDVNLNGLHTVTTTVLPALLVAGGTVVNIASTAAFVVGGGGAAYTTSKHGVLGFTRQLAVDYGPLGVRSNAVCPGAIDTELTAPIWTAHPESREHYEAVPAGRIGRAEEVAALILFLAGAESSYIYGAGVMIDGGLTLT